VQNIRSTFRIKLTKRTIVARNLLKNTVVRLRFQIDEVKKTLYIAAEPAKGEPDEPEALQAILVLSDLLAAGGLSFEIYQRNTKVRGVDAPDAIVMSPYRPLPQFDSIVGETKR
jgi:hypothetical protein